MDGRRISKSTLFNVLVLFCFTVLFLSRRNYEFLVYTVTLSGLIYVIEWSDRRLGYSGLAKWGFCVWLVSHLVGGSVNVGDQRLYDTVLIDIVGGPYHILRYDQAVHVYCYFIITLFVCSLVSHVSREKANKAVVVLVVVLTSLGISAVNEIIEFSAVVIFHSEGVGDYYNNALDMVFNLLGIVAALGFVGWGRSKVEIEV